MPAEISVRDLDSFIKRKMPLHLVDVREQWERAIAALPDQAHIPLDQLPARVDELKPKGALIVFYCHHGVRSLAAAGFMEERGHTEVVSLAGGVDQWARQIDPTVPIYF
jgi:adenylyltransferase/sulfurtransferase